MIQFAFFHPISAPVGGRKEEEASISLLTQGVVEGIGSI